MYRKSHI